MRSKVLSSARRLGPGLALVAALALVARLAAGAFSSVISEVTFGVLIGLVVGNAYGLRRTFIPGVKFAGGTPLRLGIALLGARLSVIDVIETGVGSLLIIVVCMVSALLIVMSVGRLLHLPTRLTVLIGVGTAVCGNSAIIATAPVIQAEERDVSFAVATITLFGTVAVLVFPLVGHVLGLSDRLFGHWAGVAVNDTSQVTAAGFAYSSSAGETATIVKLTRNTLLGPLLIVIGAIYAKAREGIRPDGPSETSRLSILRVMPPFVIGFVALAMLNSAGLIPAAMSGGLSEASRGLILLALARIHRSRPAERLPRSRTGAHLS